MNDPSVVLQAIYDAFTSRLSSYTGFDLPRRRYIHVGEVAADCAQLVVHTAGIYQGTPGKPTPGYLDESAGMGMLAMDVSVTLFRAVPTQDNTGAPPATSKLTSSALGAGKDAKALTDVYFAAHSANELAGSCQTMYYGGITWVGPEGGMLGTSLDLAVQL